MYAQAIIVRALAQLQDSIMERRYSDITQNLAVRTLLPAFHMLL